MYVFMILMIRVLESGVCAYLEMNSQGNQYEPLEERYKLYIASCIKFKIATGHAMYAKQHTRQIESKNQPAGISPLFPSNVNLISSCDISEPKFDQLPTNLTPFLTAAA